MIILEKKIIKILIIVVLHISVYECRFNATREKRYLVYPNGGTFKAIIGLAVPIKIGSKQSLAYVSNFQFQYGYPKSSKDLLKPYPPEVERHIRSSNQIYKEQIIMYTTIEHILSRLGVDGHSCLLRSICENAERKTHADELYTELLQIILNPFFDSKSIDDEYSNAYLAGDYGVDCHSMYQGCPINFNLFKYVPEV